MTIAVAADTGESFAWALVLRVSVPGAPQPKERPRFGGGRARTPERTAAWEALAALHLRNGRGRAEVLSEPVRVVVRAVGKRPIRRPERVRPEVWGTGARAWRIGQADIDNIVKISLDAVTLAGVWTDDNLVVSLEAVSMYASAKEGPCVEIEIWRLANG